MAILQSLQEANFTFDCDGSESELRVINFKGKESMSNLFRFEIDLVSTDTDIDFDKVLQGKATLSIRRGEDVEAFGGILRRFEQLEMGTTYAHYRALLMPRLWLLKTTRQSRIFQDQTTPEIVAEVLKEYGFTSEDLSLKVTKSYPKREYAVQYQETDFNFVSRLLEHEGIFYFFYKSKLIIADDSSIHQPISEPSEIVYRSSSGLESKGQESVRSLTCSQQTVPRKVVLKDYNWRKPGLDLKTQRSAVEKGYGTFIAYGDHYKDSGEGKQLAQVRTEQIKCGRRLVSGTSDCRGFRAGCKYRLDDHYRDDLNGQYLLVEVRHSGSQSGAFLEGLPGGASDQAPDYKNEFVSILAEVPFRPRCKTPKPKLHGTLNAKVDASGSGQYAELDEHGRYKVIMPFDLSGKGGGKATRYIRMAQPYAGSNYGMHFPLHKGTEVLWTCIDGDLDRPIICGAVPNPDNTSPVTSANQTKSVVRDYGGNEIVLEGVESEQQIRLHSPRHNTTITLGNSISGYTESEIVLNSAQNQVYIEANTQITLHVGESSLYMNKDGSIELRGKHVTIVGTERVDINPP